MSFTEEQLTTISDETSTDLFKERDAVANAMSVALNRSLQPAEQMYNSRDDAYFFPHINKTTKWQDLSMEDVLHETTRGKCEENSVAAIAYLASKKPELFDNFFLLEGYRTKEYYRHVYFVAQGKDGTYFVGSPANTHILESNLTDIIEADNIESLIKQIEDRDSGNWPNAQEVGQILLESPRTCALLSDDKMELSCISTDYTVSNVHKRAHHTALTFDI